MKSYDEIYENVLRRRDEQMAKKRRRIAVAGSLVLPAIMLTAAAAVGIAAFQNRPYTEGGANAGGNADTSSAEAAWITESPVRLIDGRVFLMDSGMTRDITDEISEDRPYLFVGSDPLTGLRRIMMIGGTPENCGWAKFVMYEKDTEQPENSKWKCYSCNTFTADRQDRRWYERAMATLCYTPEENGIRLWSMTERAWELVNLDGNGGPDKTVVEYSMYGYTAVLELLNVTHSPADFENYYSAKGLKVTVTDPEGRTAAVSTIDSPSLGNNVSIWSAFLEEFKLRHVETSLKLLEMDYNGEKHYALALRGGNDDGGVLRYVTVFFALEPECFADGQLRLYKAGTTTNYSVVTTDEIRNKAGTVFTDTGEGGWHDYTIRFDPENYSFSYEPTAAVTGESAVLAECSGYGYRAELSMKGAIKAFRNDKDYYYAEDTVVTVSDGLGNTASASLSANDSVQGEYYGLLNGSYTSSTMEILELDDMGEKRYVIMLCCFCGGENESRRTLFFGFDPAGFTLTPYTMNGEYSYFVDTEGTKMTVSRSGSDGLLFNNCEIRFDYGKYDFTCTPLNG
ncbi:MAG: hypothetical protein J1F60_06885 [Oscillospiraceae bacterium]|nr:hypothetical protein [Oscillospiraceae bacterium]